MLRPPDHLRGRPLLHQHPFSITATRSAKRRTRFRSCVNEKQRHAGVGAQALQQLQDLQADRDVERGGRLVGDQELRVARERHRDHRALALAAGELVRIAVRAALGLVDPDPAHRATASFHAAAPRRSVCSSSDSTIWSPTV